ncbi:MAG: LPP20 family lipoprotein [Gammaproteobacteria bacterium]|nr:LPP20 family lipoprotein [Gammaproteobacteria bacterium]
MNSSKILLCALAVVGVIAAGCSANTPKESASYVSDCTYPDGSNKEAPMWICTETTKDFPVGAVGSSEKSAAGFSFMEQQAATVARVKLAQQMRVQVQNMVKQYVEVSGAADAETVDKVNTSISKQITNESLSGTRIVLKNTSPNGVLFVYVGLDPKAVQQLAQEAIKTSMNNDAALWQQFKAQKGQDELAADIAKSTPAAQ